MRHPVSLPTPDPDFRLPPALLRLWDRLTAPAPRLTDMEARRDSRLLNALLLVLLTAGLPIFVLETGLSPTAGQDADYLYLSLLVLIVPVLYIQARLGYRHCAATALIALLFVFFTVLPFSENSLPQLPFFIVVPVLLTAMFFSARALRLLVGLSIVVPLVIGLVALPPQMTDLDLLRNVLFNAMIGGFIMVTIHHRSAIEYLRREELQAAYEKVRASEAALETRVDMRTQALQQRDAVLEAVAQASEAFLTSPNWRHVIDDVLAGLGTAVEASRIYIFERQLPQRGQAPQGPVIVDQTYEWVAAGIAPEIDNPELQNLDLSDLFPRWVAHFGQSDIISGVVSDFPEGERSILEPQQIVAIIVMPIIVDGQWWGFIGFDECTGERQWTRAEIDLLRSAASSLGATIQRQQVEQQMQSQNVALVKANLELAVARRQAEESTRLKSEFLATMSHELRTPLNAVIGYSQLQLAGMVGELSAEQHTFQERILANAQHLLQLINEVLDLSKIEAGRLEIHERPFEVSEMVSEVMTQNRVLAEDKGLEFAASIDPALPPHIMGDRGRIKQIIINLVSNAIKFTDEGRVDLHVRMADPDQWRICVQDTGIGIPAHTQETIFDEFRQAEEGHHRGGTGLGLAIVRKLALAMGGSVQLKSEVGSGSIFTVTLPLTPVDHNVLLEGEHTV